MQKTPIKENKEHYEKLIFEPYKFYTEMATVPLPRYYLLLLTH